jgi:nucleotide-binding universal stress UspA family protein
MFCVIAGRAVDHSKCVTTAHPVDRQPAAMFSSVVVGVKELEAGRDALCLARALTAANGNLTLAHVQVVAPKPAPDSGAGWAAARRQDALERLTTLRDESRLDAEVVYSEAGGVRAGLHGIARTRGADLLVISASRQDESYRDLVGDDARDLLDNPPCAVAVAPRIFR